MPSTNSAKSRARALMKERGIKYTEALRLVEKATAPNTPTTDVRACNSCGKSRVGCDALIIANPKASWPHSKCCEDCAFGYTHKVNLTDGRFGPHTSEVETYLASLSGLAPRRVALETDESTPTWQDRMREVGLTGAPWFQYVPGYRDLEGACRAAENAVAMEIRSEIDRWGAMFAAQAIVLMDLLTPEQFRIVTEPMRGTGATLPRHTGERATGGTIDQIRTVADAETLPLGQHVKVGDTLLVKIGTHLFEDVEAGVTLDVLDILPFGDADLPILLVDSPDVPDLTGLIESLRGLTDEQWEPIERMFRYSDDYCVVAALGEVVADRLRPSGRFLMFEKSLWDVSDQIGIGRGWTARPRRYVLEDAVLAIFARDLISDDEFETLVAPLRAIGATLPK